MKGINIGIGVTVVGLAAMNAEAALQVSPISSPSQIQVPIDQSGFEVFASALHLHTSNSDLNWLSVATGNQVNLRKLDPGSSWGFNVGAGYIFPNTGNDVRIDWTHLGNPDDSDSLVRQANQAFAIPIPFASLFFFVGEAPDNLGTINSATANVDFKYDVVNADVGQFIDVGTRLQTRISTGLQYARLKRQFDRTYSGTVPSNEGVRSLAPFTLAAEQSTEFKGIGPEVGIDATYNAFYGFGIAGHATASVLIGDVDASSNYSSVLLPVATIPTAISTSEIQNDSHRRIVPAVSAKLGFNYTYAFDPESTRSVNAELGYQVAHYYNAFDALNAVPITPTVPNSPITVGQRVTSNVAFDGPYVTLMVKI